MKKTWLPTAAGILDIIQGGLNLVGVFVLTYALSLISTAPTTLTVITILASISGILAVICGFYTLQRKIWGLALAGSIAAIFPASILGVLATVFTVMSKNEFD
jgi:hypothetical protein